MKRIKFSKAQIAFILRQDEECTPVGEVAGISEATYYNWRNKYGGLTPSEMKRLRQLEEENSKLKKIVADLSFDQTTAPVERDRPSSSRIGSARPRAALEDRFSVEFTRCVPIVWNRISRSAMRGLQR
jgi:putative transposase